MEARARRRKQSIALARVPPAERKIAALLARTRAGDVAATNKLFVIVYPVLRRFAGRFMRQQPASHTLQPSALVNEAYLRMIRKTDGWDTPKHFLAAAATAMRCVLVDSARARKLRVGCTVAQDLDEVLVKFEERAIDLIALGDGLERLDRERPLAARIVDLCFFGGETFPTIARVLNVPQRTVEREWHTARVWLHAMIDRS